MMTPFRVSMKFAIAVSGAILVLPERGYGDGPIGLIHNMLFGQSVKYPGIHLRFHI